MSQAVGTQTSSFTPATGSVTATTYLTPKNDPDDTVIHPWPVDPATRSRPGRVLACPGQRWNLRAPEHIAHRSARPRAERAPRRAGSAPRRPGRSVWGALEVNRP